jgi:DNA repair protein RadC
MSEQPSFSFDEASPRFVPAGVGRAVGAVARGPSKGAEMHRHAHRDRLRTRFTHGGADAVPDYELLEMLLYRALPRGDTKPLAKRLLRLFGDLNHVIAAAPARLREVEGVGDRVIFELKLMEAVGHRMARAQVIGKPLLSSWG